MHMCTRTHHQATWLFHEEWLKKSSCESVPHFPPPCGDVAGGGGGSGSGSVRGSGSGSSSSSSSSSDSGSDNDDGGDDGDGEEGSVLAALPAPTNLTSARTGVTATSMDGWDELSPQFLPLWGHPSKQEVATLTAQRRGGDKTEGPVARASLAAVRQVTVDGVVGPLDSPRTRLLSLADGLAFDIEAGSFCAVTSAGVKRHQKEFTYMREYKIALAISRRVSDVEWNTRYRTRGGGESRSGPRCRTVNDVGKHGDELVSIEEWPDHLRMHQRHDFVCREDGFLWRVKKSLIDVSGAMEHATDVHETARDAGAVAGTGTGTEDGGWGGRLLPWNNWYRTRGAASGAAACSLCVTRPASVSLTGTGTGNVTTAAALSGGAEVTEAADAAAGWAQTAYVAAMQVVDCSDMGHSHAHFAKSDFIDKE